MKTISVGEFKAHFSEVIDDLWSGEEITNEKLERKLGILDGRAQAILNDGFKMTEEEFMAL